MTRPASEIRAEIERMNDEIKASIKYGVGGGGDRYVARIEALEWVLSAPTAAPSDEKIVEAMLVAANDVLNDDDTDHAGSMRAALGAAHPMIERAARDEALLEAAEICWNASGHLDARDAILALRETEDV